MFNKPKRHSGKVIRTIEWREFDQRIPVEIRVQVGKAHGRHRTPSKSTDSLQDAITYSAHLDAYNIHVDGEKNADDVWKQVCDELRGRFGIMWTQYIKVVANVSKEESWRFNSDDDSSDSRSLGITYQVVSFGVRPDKSECYKEAPIKKDNAHIRDGRPKEGYKDGNTKEVVSYVLDTPENRVKLTMMLKAIENAGAFIRKALQPDTIQKTLAGGKNLLAMTPEPDKKTQVAKKKNSA